MDDGSFSLGLTLTKPGKLMHVDIRADAIARSLSQIKMRSQWKMAEVGFVKLTMRNLVQLLVANGAYPSEH